MQWARKQTGFTIVELLIVVVVIAILAAVTIVAYNGISAQAKEAALKSDLESAAKQLLVAKAQTGSLPADDSAVKKSDTTTLVYSRTDDHAFCLAATSSALPGKTYRITESGVIEEGGCSGGGIANGVLIQTITNDNCPADRTRAVDARDNHTYWVQKLADGKCWMLTNLAYGGDGVNTYGDVMLAGDGTPGTPRGTLSNGTADTSSTYTAAKYYIVPNTTNYTIEPASPSTSTNGTGQYGYLYNFCAANGGQASTGPWGISACTTGSSTAVNTSVSICPSGWKLPTGGSSSEFAALNASVNGGATNTDLGMRDAWLAQYSGQWGGTFSSQGGYGYYWTSLHSGSNAAYYMSLWNTHVGPGQSSGVKNSNMAVRCLAI